MEGEFDPRLLRENAVLIDRDVLVDLYQGLKKVLMFAGGLLYTASKKAGKLTAQRLMSRGLLSRDNCFRLLLWSFVEAGYTDGISVENVEESRGKIIVTVKAIGTLLGSRLRDKRPVDQPLAGFMAGWLEEVYGCKVDVREMECQAQGRSACVFRIIVHCNPENLDAKPGLTYGRRPGP